MKFIVNDNCIGCGLCEAVCPAVFELMDGHAAAKNVDTDDADAVAAMEGCPVAAIEKK